MTVDAVPGEDLVRRGLADLQADAERLERFRREAQAVEDIDGVQFITLERVDGPTLDRLIK